MRTLAAQAQDRLVVVSFLALVLRLGEVVLARFSGVSLVSTDRVIGCSSPAHWMLGYGRRMQAGYFECKML